jgi:hypothetical protein
MFDSSAFDSAVFDTGEEIVILSPPIWGSVRLIGEGWTATAHGTGLSWDRITVAGNGWTLTAHGQGDPWAAESDPETVWN